MALLYLGEDPWIREHESCEKLNRDILEQLSQRQTCPRSSEKYSQLSANVRLRLKQYLNEVGQLNQKLDIATRAGSITSDEAERRIRQVEVLHSKGIQMQKQFNNQVMSKLKEDRAQLMSGVGSSVWAEDRNLVQNNTNKTVEELRADQRRLLNEQDQGLENLSRIISRQKSVASTISTEVDFHNEILDGLGTQIDNTDQRVRAETQHISVVDTKDRTCIYWVTIIFLFIAILIVAFI